MKPALPYAWVIFTALSVMILSCNQKPSESSQQQQIQKEVTAKDILGNSKYQAISYGGYRTKTRDIQPTIDELKEDIQILRAMNIKVLRTYNVHFPQASNILRVIHEMKAEDPTFEMYVMLGAWIDCVGAFTDDPNHNKEDVESNSAEIEEAVRLANLYPDIVKVLAVGNESMVRWAASYYVKPNVILKWVNHLQDIKRSGGLHQDLWITCSDDYASWGGGDTSYRTDELEELIKAVDYVSMHTYPYHNTHYNPDFWGVKNGEDSLPDIGKIEAAMDRALQFSMLQYDSVSAYINNISPGKEVHIGETGWATVSSGHYGPKGSKATDEFKEALFYKGMRDWTNKTGISCFYFEAFNERWKDSHNNKGSENHFGLFTVDGKAKYALWDLVDKGVFDGLTRNGNPITKTYDGDIEELLQDVELPPVKNEITVDY